MSEASKIEQKRPRGTGCVYQQKGSSNWWIQYYRNGKPYRQSAGTSKRRKAEQMLQRKLAEIANHTFIDPKAERTLVKELAEDFLRDYRINGRKSLSDVEARWRLHLSKEFGDHRAANVGHDQMTRYVAQRQTEGASNATINRELAALKRMFTLGVRARKVYSMPTFPHLEERNVRSRSQAYAHSFTHASKLPTFAKSRAFSIFSLCNSSTRMNHSSLTEKCMRRKSLRVSKTHQRKMRF